MVGLLLRSAAIEQAPWDGHTVHKPELEDRDKVRARGAGGRLHLLQPRVDLIWKLVLIFLLSNLMIIILIIKQRSPDEEKR